MAHHAPTGRCTGPQKTETTAKVCFAFPATFAFKAANIPTDVKRKFARMFALQNLSIEILMIACIDLCPTRMTYQQDHHTQKCCKVSVLTLIFDTIVQGILRKTMAIAPGNHRNEVSNFALHCHVRLRKIICFHHDRCSIDKIYSGHSCPHSDWSMHGHFQNLVNTALIQCTGRSLAFKLLFFKKKFIQKDFCGFIIGSYR